MTYVHVLPLLPPLDGHVESERCWCHPLPSLWIGTDRVIVHRPESKYVPLLPFVPLDRVREKA